MLEYLSNPIVLFIVFFVFLVTVRALFKVITGALFIGALGALFPIVLVKVFGYPMELSLTTCLFWATVGVAANLCWTIIKAWFNFSQISDFIWDVVKAIFFPVRLVWKGIKAIVWIDEKKEKKKTTS